ncbi:NINE protein [Oculatella sp. LEGE 06141]|uniref:NINE protein n=1 Tax=Oculatella sp. LEGE 06141 TaxID=1828648 RepID=UPI001881B7B6|nr:NINE protein [Oculatella sp. LEGE 06141]MBE9180821.1 NINE protein [Oculatella sp. LEGE 06141]
MNDTKTSYLLWLGVFFGAAGLHRLHNRKIASGLLWFCTYGLFGVGQLVDLFLIPNMVEEHNLRLRAKLGTSPTGVPLNQSTIQFVIPPEAIAQSGPPSVSSQSAEAKSLTREQMMIKLLKSAESRGGKISVTQGVLDTGLGFEEVEAILKDMSRLGYVAIENHPSTGVVTYNFLEL